MAFTDLPTTLQTIETYNYSVFSKVFWIFLIISVSLFYVFYYVPYLQKKTPFMSLAITRSILNIFSIINIVSIPLLFFVMDPNYDVWDFIKPYFMIYTTGISIFMAVSFRDLIAIGIPLLLRRGGLDYDNPDVKLAEKQLFRKNGKSNR